MDELLQQILFGLCVINFIALEDRLLIENPEY